MYILFDLLYNTIFILFNNNMIDNFNFDTLLYTLNLYEYTDYINGCYKNSNIFYIYILNKFIFNFYYFLFSFDEYLYHIIIYSFNLPLFFYFGILFIFTTLSSLVLLSYLGLYGVFLLNLFSLFLFWLSTSLYVNVFFVDNIFIKINLGKWFIVNINYPIFFELFIDSISFSFMFLTLTIATFVYIYAFSYFRYEPNVERLILLINCFVISMVCLVTSGNFFVLFLG